MTNAWEIWMNVEASTAVGWALVHFLWQGALIALALRLMLLAGGSARARYGAAGVALLTMLLVFLITAVVSMPEQGRPSSPAWTAAADAYASPGDGLAGNPVTFAALVQGALPWVVPLWMAGVLLMGVYRCGGWLAARRMCRVGASSAPVAWQERLQALARRIGVSRPVALLESGLTGTPVVLGVLKPAILAPVGFFTAMPAAHVEAILMHELAHIRRADYLVNLAQAVVESVLFYHPAVWWVSGVVRSQRENCCDDVVVAARGEAVGYAAALVALEEWRVAGREPALAATGGSLMDRVRRLLDGRNERRSAGGLLVSLGLLLLSLALLAGAQQAGLTGGEDEADTPFSKWLKEDVVYIIADEEEAAFERLGTNEERERFIEQFWKRRDPSPATQRNEFKEEHYRRIAYANARFPSSLPGWRTDRGRIYIQYGPPDEIESHPSEGRELWRYRELKGLRDDGAAEKDAIFLFVDTDNTGEYREQGVTIKMNWNRPPRLNGIAFRG